MEVTFLPFSCRFITNLVSYLVSSVTTWIEVTWVNYKTISIFCSSKNWSLLPCFLHSFISHVCDYDVCLSSNLKPQPATMETREITDRNKSRWVHLTQSRHCSLLVLRKTARKYLTPTHTICITHITMNVQSSKETCTLNCALSPDLAAMVTSDILRISYILKHRVNYLNFDFSGMGYRPGPPPANVGSTLVWYKGKNPSNFQYWIDSLEDFLRGKNNVLTLNNPRWGPGE